MVKKLLKFLVYGLLGFVGLCFIIYIGFIIKWYSNSSNNMKLLGKEAPLLEIDGVTFRDLNKNNELDSYENHTLGINERIDDLMNKMTLEEKAGLMFISMIGMNADGSLNEIPFFAEPLSFFLESNSSLVVRKKMNHFNIIQALTPQAMAKWNNQIQKLAERTRLGIPVTIATDPRHVNDKNIGAAIATPFFSSWCSSLGFAAIQDTSLMRKFGNIARQEYKAIGIRLALSPMADLATEPRWGRINGTFGEDAELSAQLTKAYIQGFQGDTLGSLSVACMVKHFSGGGPQKDGEDAHFPYGAEQIYPGNNFDYHLIPFERGAFPANVAQVMPYYGIPMGQTDEDVAFGFNRAIITGLLREKYNFDGVVCTDWGLITDMFVKPASAWGVENLSPLERVEKIINAGCDMFGGEAVPDLVVQLVKLGKISEDRINTSIKRILRDKFLLGLFDNPYVDEQDLSIFKNDKFIKMGEESQRKSMVLLKNENNFLPLRKETKIFVQGLDKDIASKFGQLVDDVEQAEYILLNINTPFEPRSQYMLELFFHQGRLDFPEDEKKELLALIASKPTVTVINLERPAVIPMINEKSKSLIANFGSSDKIIFELIFGKFSPSGKLPFQMPSSVISVKNQKEDVPFDLKNPLYPFGYGLTF